MKFTLTQASPTSDTFKHNGGTIQTLAVGTFDGATMNMETTQDDVGSFVTLDDYAQTADHNLLVDLQPGTQYKFSLSGATGSSSVEVSII